MNQYNRMFRMLFGVVAFLLLSCISVMLNDDLQYTRLSTICFLIGCYLFLYFLLLILASIILYRSIKNITKKISKNHFLKISLKERIWYLKDINWLLIWVF